MTDLSPTDTAKNAAAIAAVALVQDGMRLGLGTGSTAVFMVRRLAERVQAEHDGRAAEIEAWLEQAESSATPV